MISLNFHIANTPRPLLRDHLHLGGQNDAGNKIELNSHFIEKNGMPWLAIMGEFPFSRYPSTEWEAELWKIKAGGIQVVSTYVLWIHHEEDEGEFDWTGRRNLRLFLQTCLRCGLQVMLRIGPFCHGEARNGGLPDWLYGRDFDARSNDPSYLHYVRRFYGEIGRQTKGLMFSDNGPVIGIQCENEFMDSAAPWETTHFLAAEYTPKGSGGVDHMLVLKQIAIEAGLNSPLFAATGWDSAPTVEKEFLPMFGAYAFHGWAEGPQAPTGSYLFVDKHNGQIPFATCEIGGGMQAFYKNRPVVPAASVEAMQIIYLGNGTNLLGYYVYHGGTNPVGKHSYLNEHRCPRISYDFQAPLRDFGQMTESYHRLRRQFLFVQSWGHRLAPLPVFLPDGKLPESPTDTETLRGSVRGDSSNGFVFLNNYQDHVEMTEKGPFQIKLYFSDHKILFPRQQELRLPPNASTILPYRLDLSGIELIYATAQPLTEITSGDVIHYFFFSLTDLPSEYAFSPRNIRRMEVAHGKSQQTEAGFLVSIKPGRTSLIKIETISGEQIWITSLSNADSLRFWKAPFLGSIRACISDVDLLITDKDMSLLPGDVSEGSIALWPPLERPLLCQFRESSPQFQGVFEHHDFTFDGLMVPCEIRNKTERLAIVTLPPGALDDLDELLLSIEYAGDMGTAYLDGKLIHDNFSNGLPWEIGLKRFARKDRETKIVIRISPKPSPDMASRVIIGSMANITAVEDETAVARIQSIRTIPRHKIQLSLARQPDSQCDAVQFSNVAV